MQNNFFPYTRQELDFLSQADPVLGEAIERIGHIHREVSPLPYPALIRNIVGQQISTKAAATVWGRLCQLAGEFTPEAISELSADQIQKCGMTGKKAANILAISSAVIDGTIDFDEFPSMTDHELTKLLSTLPGIGVWTAEMLLLFTFLRPDIVSWGDLAIRRGMMRLYKLETLSKKEFLEYRKNYSPYGSVASLYLWALAAN